MNILGYTQNKKVELVDLPIETVVNEGIDPWRIDLFDPDPVKVQLGRKTFFFRRLRDVSFAYEDACGKLNICLHDGETACFAGTRYARELGDRNPDHLLCRNIRVSREPFSAHLKRFISQPEKGPSFVPRTAAAVEIRGNIISFDANQRRKSTMLLPFTGKMFEPVTAVKQLSDEFNFILDELKDARPIIVGDALIRFLSGAKPKTGLLLKVGSEAVSVQNLDVYVKASAFSEVKARLSSRIIGVAGPGQGIFVALNGHAFCVRSRPDQVAATEFASIHSPSPYSPELLYSSKPNTLSGPRIALFDAAAKQARALFKLDSEYAVFRQDLSRDRLEESGYKIYPLPARFKVEVKEMWFAPGSFETATISLQA